MSTKNPTIAELVAEHIDELREMTEHSALRKWAEDHCLMTQQRFPRFKKALLTHGIDYAEMRSGARAQRAASATHEITLFSDAKASKLRFGICDQDGEPVWHGRDFDENDEQSAAEMAAAKKAVWLAGKVRERRGLDLLKLNLMVDAQWLVYANRETGGGKAGELRAAAQRAGVVLHAEWISGKENPADKWTVSGGFLKWSDRIDHIEVSRIETTIIDWEAVYEDVTAEEIAAADTPEKVEELAVELAAVAIDFLPAEATYTVDLADIEQGIVAERV